MKFEEKIKERFLYSKKNNVLKILYFFLQRFKLKDIKQYEGMMKEVEEAMNDFRESKKTIEDKKAIAKEKIERLK